MAKKKELEADLDLTARELANVEKQRDELLAEVAECRAEIRAQSRRISELEHGNPITDPYAALRQRIDADIASEQDATRNWSLIQVRKELAKLR